MKIGIVLLNYKDFRITKEAAERSCNLSIDHIVIVDNNSPNESAKELSKIHHSKVTFIESNENNGYASGNNQGVRYLLKETDCDIIGIVNPDVIIDESFIKQIKDDFYNYKNFSVITGIQYKPNHGISDRAFWPLLTKMDVLISNTILLNHIFGVNNKQYIKGKLNTSQNIIQVGTVEGCCFFIRREDFEQVSLFEEDTFLFFEEDILAQKLHRIGKKIAVDKKISFLHNHSTTIKSVFSQYQVDKLLLRSREVFYRKYFEKNMVDRALYFFSKILFFVERPLWYLYRGFRLRFQNRK